MKFKNLIQITAIAGAALALQACGSSDSENFILVTNTKVGHVCVDGLGVKATSAAAQDVGNVLYYYYGYKGGERDINSGDVPCSRAKETGAREPDRVVSASDYTNILVPAYNARK
jgi:hypothetical protein